MASPLGEEVAVYLKGLPEKPVILQLGKRSALGRVANARCPCRRVAQGTAVEGTQDGLLCPSFSKGQHPRQQQACPSWTGQALRHLRTVQCMPVSFEAATRGKLNQRRLARP